MPEDAVTIVVVRTNVGNSFRYWQLFLQQIVTTLQAGIVFYILNFNIIEKLFWGVEDDDKRKFFHVTFTLCYILLGLTVASLVLTYLYSTDTFILVHLLLVTFCLHRRYPHQVKQVNLTTILPLLSR